MVLLNASFDGNSSGLKLDSGVGTDSPNVSGAEPARRRLQPAPSAHPWKTAAAWAQKELLQSPPGQTQANNSAAAQMPRVSQPLRVEPPAEYNAPARVESLHHGAGKRATEQASAGALHSPPLPLAAAAQDAQDAQARASA